MSYKEKPQIKLYKYENSAFVLQAIIEDFAECSFENNRYSAGQFSITINYNIHNALKFERGLWVQFGNNPYAFGEILNITDSIGEDGKGSQLRIITGYDARYIFKRRIIKNLNNVENWQMTAKGEICMRNLIKDQCGSGAELKRQLPIINVIPDVADAIGKSYSVAESFTNLYEVLTTIATQTEIGWRINFNGSLSLEFYEGTDRHLTVRFDTDYESLSNGEFKDSAEAFANSVYVGGKGTGSDRDIYEGESAIEGESPSGLERFEAWDNQSSMNTESEYEAEALSVLNQYGQTLQVSGQGLAKCPYEYGKEYNVGDIITIAFSGKSAIVQILSVTEHWAWGSYDLEFSFGKPQPDLNKQLQLILKQIQKASNKNSTTDSVRWYTIPTDTAMPSGDVVYTTIGFVGTCAENGSTFQLYLDDEKTGAKTYHVYFKQLGGGNLTLTTGKTGATDLVLSSGTYVIIAYVDEDGNISSASATPTDNIAIDNMNPVTSNAVATSNAMPVDTVTSGDMHSVTSNAVANALSYSTSEQFTGAYWIDGKPIYKKTVSTDITTFNDNGTTRSFSLSSFVTNADSLVKAEGFWIWSEIGTSGTLNRKIILGGVTFGSNNLVLWSSDVYTSPSTNAINAYFYVYKSLYDIRKIKVRINVFYTKTTDTATRSIPTENTRKVEEETKDEEPIEEPKEEEKK